MFLQAEARLFVAISGLPCSGKSTLARQLAPALNLPAIDKDEILEGLFESQGIGDAAWRRKLSRQSDVLFEAEARAAAGAVLVSFWRVPGMPRDSGTPSGWLAELAGQAVEVHCACPPEICAERFARRRRHPGHLDGEASHDGILRSLRAIPRGGALGRARHLVVDTSREIAIGDVVRGVLDVWPR